MILRLLKARRSFRYALALVCRKFAFLQGRLPPLSVHLFPSLTCSSRCFFCWIWGQEGYAFSRPSSAYPFSLFEELIEQLPYLTGEVVFMGGEPTLHSQLWQLIEKAKRKGLRTLLVSSGCDNFPKNIVSILDAFILSLDGVQEVHDAVRGEGSYEHAVTSLRALNARKKKEKSLFPELFVSFTIHARNQSSLLRFLEELEEMEALDRILSGISFHHLEFVGKEEVKGLAHGYPVPSPDPAFWKSFQIEPAVDVEELLLQIGTVKERRWKFPVSFSPDLSEEDLRRYYQKTIPFRGCAFIETKAHVLPEGEVWLCPGLTIGNVKQKRLGALWQSERARQVRRWIQSGKAFSVCARCPGNRLG